jgi:hypothetical protein
MNADGNGCTFAKQIKRQFFDNFGIVHVRSARHATQIILGVVMLNKEAGQRYLDEMRNYLGIHLFNNLTTSAQDEWKVLNGSLSL